MDGSPLVLAQNHARQASKANNPKAAIEEHNLAAGKFANAAQGTQSSEAFRTLKLLEQHHEKLSQLLKFQTSHPRPPTSDDLVGPSEAAPPTSLPNAAQGQDGALYRPQSQSLPAAHRPQRDKSSSIAGTLASARGIPSSKQRRSGQPSSPAVAQQNAEGRIVTPPRRSKLGEGSGNIHHDDTASEKAAAGGQSTRRDGAIPPSKETVPDGSPRPADDAFNRFYNTFESLFSKLSAPLAFAGLPLNPDADDSTSANDLVSPNKQSSSSNPLTPKPKKLSSSARTPSSSSRRATAEPAYSQLFSPAALAAVREEPGNAGALGAPGESFYVVPTAGGTMPYASILARHQQHSAGSHHNRSLSRDSSALSEDMDEFVDARETPGLGGGGDSPVMSRAGITTNKKGGSSRGGGVGPAGSNPNQKNMEELQLENESLRSVLDEMSRRLWQFEMGAQMGSVALHQSIRASLNRGPPPSSDAGVIVSSGNNKERATTATTATTVPADGSPHSNNRLSALEDDLKRQKRDVERMGRENEKLKGVVGRYRERWEKLKEGARTRQKVPSTTANAGREGGAGGSGGGGGGGGGGGEGALEGEEI